ncbi:MAG: LLM class flavin-dependent oxidoreductase [Candidatus Rokubacteria bacterium]|nr:LLM class flavin-dependent oxidoreductase [Candidatus Rokubacteria bacterium]
MTAVPGFGVQLRSHPPERQWRIVRRLEELAFDSVWTGDHVAFNVPLHESLTLLASYTPITHRIRIGTCVYLLALRAPAVAAKMTATLDVLSGGRFIFGVGVGGEIPKEFELCGVPHRERGARVTEAIDVVRTLWRDTPATFEGRFTRFLARAGCQGDGWVSYVVHPERYRESVARIRAAAEAAGRTLDGFVCAHLTFITVARDYESAKADWVRLLSRRYAQDFAPLAEKYGVIGTAEQCAEKIERFREAGCTYFILDTIVDPEQQQEHLELIAAEVLPRLVPR